MSQGPWKGTGHTMGPQWLHQGRHTTSALHHDSRKGKSNGPAPWLRQGLDGKRFRRGCDICRDRYGNRSCSMWVGSINAEFIMSAILPQPIDRKRKTFSLSWHRRQPHTSRCANITGDGKSPQNTRRQLHPSCPRDHHPPNLAYTYWPPPCWCWGSQRGPFFSTKSTPDPSRSMTGAGHGPA